MSAIRFDTLDYANKLKEVGFTDKQAEVQAHGLADILNNNLCTKEDLLLVKSELREDMQKVRNEIKEVKIDLIKWTIGLLLAQTGLILTIINFMSKHT